MAKKTAQQFNAYAYALRPSDEPIEGPVLVAFDFDGTLTVKDSFKAFLAWRAGPIRYGYGMVRLLPAAIRYLVDKDRGRIKAAAVREFLRGVPRQRLENDAKVFAEKYAQKLFRPDALATWKRWRNKGARPVIVTASPGLIVAPFARGLGADTLIGSELCFDDNDRVTGELLGANCRGAEKVRRLRAQFGDDCHLVAAYGDTEGDKEMLEMADERGYRVFSARPGLA
ncbi:MAG TPA: HAD-IB family hydrolase [Caulobacteraceae bacterium]|nr:HAD-IB family hydrolase [Caulobacteraceae bacterium]